MSFWDDIKKFAQPYADDEDYDDYDDEMDDGYEEEPAPRYSNRRDNEAEPDEDYDAFNGSTGFANANTGSVSTGGFSGTVLNNNSGNKAQLILTRPESFNDAPAIAASLRSKKAIVLNLEGVDKALARRVVDFLSGCIFCLDGSVKKVSQATYLFCPYNMEVVGDLKSLQSEAENYV